MSRDDTDDTVKMTMLIEQNCKVAAHCLWQPSPAANSLDHSAMDNDNLWFERPPAKVLPVGGVAGKGTPGKGLFLSDENRAGAFWDIVGTLYLVGLATIDGKHTLKRGRTVAGNHWGQPQLLLLRLA